MRESASQGGVSRTSSEHCVERGWGGLRNGEFLALAQEEFEAFVTIDQSIEYQHDLKKLKLGLLVVHVPDNKINSYKPIFDAMREAAESLAPGQVLHVSRSL